LELSTNTKKSVATALLGLLCLLVMAPLQFGFEAELLLSKLAVNVIFFGNSRLLKK
jgi:hypothetical protein